MITTIYNGKTNFYWGLSTDTKPIQNMLNGSIFYEMDTGNSFVFDEENIMWRAI